MIIIHGSMMDGNGFDKLSIALQHAAPQICKLGQSVTVLECYIHDLSPAQTYIYIE